MAAIVSHGGRRVRGGRSHPVVAVCCTPYAVDHIGPPRRTLGPVDVSSLGWQTDLEMLRLGGSQFEDRGDFLVIRSPHNPSHWWGNFLLLSGPPPAHDTQHWLDTFHAELPDAAHITMGFDGVTGSVEQLASFSDAGMTVEVATVMTAREVHEPPRPNSDALYRVLSSDDDWLQQVELAVACNEDDLEPGEYREFCAARAKTRRAMVDAGHGAWFGAFLRGRMLSSMGLFISSTGLARFQSVETAPDARGRGLAGSLVHRVSEFGFRELGAHTLVMIADPTYSAIRLYRSVGFTDTETQLQAEQRPHAASEM